MTDDIVTLEGDPERGLALLTPVLKAGREVAPQPSLVLIRELVRSQLAALPAALCSLEPAAPYPVTIAPALQALAREVDRNSTAIQRVVERPAPGQETV